MISFWILRMLEPRATLPFKFVTAVIREYLL